MKHTFYLQFYALNVLNHTMYYSFYFQFGSIKNLILSYLILLLEQEEGKNTFTAITNYKWVYWHSEISKTDY